MGFFSNMFGSKNYTNINNEELKNIIKNIKYFIINLKEDGNNVKWSNFKI